MMKVWSRHLEGGRDSKMSGEEPPLEVHYTQDKTQFESTQDSLNTPVEFLFYFQIQGPITWGKTPYL